MKLIIVFTFALAVFAQAPGNMILNENGGNAYLDVEPTGCGLCDFFMIYAEPSATTFLKPHDWVGIYCDQLSVSFEKNTDYKGHTSQNGSIGIMAVAQVGSDTTKMDIAFMGTYQNKITIGDNNVQNFESVWSPNSIFDQKPQITIDSNYLYFKASPPLGIDS